MRYFAFLNDVYKSSNESQGYSEQTVNICEQLLKPWPRQLNTATNATEFKTSEEKKPETSDDPISVVEVEALAITQKALAQAQRLREKQAMVISRETNENISELDGNDCEVISTFTNRTEFSLGPESKTSQTKTFRGSKVNTSKDGVTRVQKETKSASQGPARNQARPSRICDRKSAELRNQKPEARNQPIVSATTMVPSSKNAIRQSSSKEMPLNSNVGIISQSALNRVLSELKQGGKRPMGYRPAHTQAPFKTEALIRRPKPRPASIPRQKHQPLSNISKKVEKSSEIEIAIEKRNTQKYEEAMLESEYSKTPTSFEKNLVAEWIADDSKMVDDVRPKIPGQHDVESVQISPNLAEEMEAKAEDKKFNILNEGHTLTIPSKLKKAVHKNRKLKLQIHLSALKCQATPENSPSMSFLNKLAQHYETHNSTDNLTHKTAIQLLALYKILNDVMDKCLQTKYKNRDWRDILHLKRSMENVCLYFVDMEETYNYLVSEFGDLDTRHLDTLLEIIPEKTWSSNIWLPSDTQLGIKVASNPLKYRRLKDMEEYINLMHQLQILKLELITMELAAEYLLPILNDLEPSHRYFREVYRTAYSLLCDSGKHSPMIIGDLGD